MKTIISLAFLLVTLGVCHGYVFNLCSLARELESQGIRRNDISLWCCIALKESDYNTRAVNRQNADGSEDYGIFQINSHYWCKPDSGPFAQTSANGCRINCKDLLVDDITSSVNCAKKILKNQGWSAWVTYNEYCNNPGNLESVGHCFSRNDL